MSILKVSNAKTQAAEALLGAALGGGIGYGLETKDKDTGKRRPGRKTLSGALFGTSGGMVAGQKLRMDKAGLPFSGAFRIPDSLEEAEKLKEVIEKIETGFHPFGIGIKGVKTANYKNNIIEGLSGGALGAGAGYLSEKKDGEPVGTRTLVGGVGGALGGLLTGQALRDRKYQGLRNSDDLDHYFRERNAGLEPEDAHISTLYTSMRRKLNDLRNKSNLVADSTEDDEIMQDLERSMREDQKRITPFGIGLPSLDSKLDQVGESFQQGQWPPSFSTTKNASSLAEYSVLFDEIDSGRFGDHVKEALYGVCEGVASSVQSHYEKKASSPTSMTEEDARQARLNQLLRKF